MKEALAMNIKGLKCDSCDYHDDSITLREYPKWVNKPCPECGANLLTEADFNTVQLLVNAVKMANDVFPPTEEHTHSLRLEMDGSGVPQLKEIKGLSEEDE